MIALTCALFLRVWVPAGWMPASTGGVFAIELCSGDAPAPMAMHGKASHHDGSHKAQHDGDCAFSPLHAGLATATHAPVILGPSLAAVALRDHAPSAYLATGPPAPPPPATGPPAIA